MGWFVLWLTDKIVRLRARRRGRSRCAFCARRLEPASGEFGYADRCFHCQRVQPWAQPLRDPVIRSSLRRDRRRVYDS